MEKFDLNHISVFTKIVESGNLTRTAQVLGLPKSKVSRILSRLEKDLGVQLIHRTTRNLQLTEIGRNFYERCQGPLAGLAEAARGLSESSQEIQGRIRMTAAQDLGLSLLPGPLDEFSRLYPKVKFDVILAQESLNLVQESIDIAVRIGTLKDSRLRFHPIAEVPLILVASPQFLEIRGTPSQLSDLSTLPCMGLESMKTRGWVFRAGREKKTLRIDPSLSTNNPEFTLKFALRSRGIALLPEYLCRDFLQNGSLVHILKTWKGEAVPISLVFPYQKQMPAHVRRFADFLRGRLQAALTS